MGYYELIKCNQDRTRPYYFVLKASNGKVIVSSRRYKSKYAAANGIRSVQDNGHAVNVIDRTFGQRSGGRSKDSHTLQTLDQRSLKALCKKPSST
ncbi:Prophage Lp2 protein 14 (modular protein) [Vibrio nigripulchritudo MADA3029]|uniref:YegP family protein n=1 Tax=Vibrio nigripulchritudo TaxID=28173 RepID=UPI0003B1A131|nr:YegP family protein [Vibrio nigripulchritudo]CCN38730.1 Prophage Lp2 protein 14 (modular protein) [Vibrio nigripulchritudo AM115]CCN45037.1 Prophage Lp2 protein 14 (modular protein) [Vibrio nigripulchritudo FTn2]CCN50881.1 Prophage Lp2 protein 14 (modular protein) [Vibrio nigripulchritudo MADA3020]CCN56739.1 Prophage Lp2 protein 14 (modular protein) [Vibrio nigripulchritudo MADA3021]CCN62596.1 Prophage Lp2 protein 14 (modular protein) [Vibrio nigripulchritudo MADA3029]